MSSSLTFFTFEPLREVPEVCNLCAQNPPVLLFELQIYNQSGEAEDTKGFCCASCAVELVKKLEGAEFQQWTDEEAVLQAEDLDISDLRRHRLTAFPKTGSS